MGEHSVTDLTISIVDWNSGEQILNCIESIVTTIKNHSYKVIVIDNHSEIKSINAIRTRFPFISIIENMQNLGYARAHNKVLTCITSRYVLLLNPDTIVGEHAVDTVLEYMDADPRIGIAGCRVLLDDGSIQNTVISFPSVGSEAKRAVRESCWPLEKLLPQRRLPSSSVPNKPSRVTAIGGPFIMIRGDMIKDTGPLDGAFFLFSEERDLCIRARQRNWGCAYIPTASITHLLGKCRDHAPSSFSSYHFHRSRLLYFMKHHNRTDFMFLVLIYTFISLWALTIELLKMGAGRLMGIRKGYNYIDLSIAPVRAVWSVLRETRFFTRL